MEEIKKTQFPITRKGVTYDLEFETEHVRAVRATLGIRSWFEIFERRVNAAREIEGVKICPSEAFPNDEAFGKWAFVCETPHHVSDKAIEIINKILARELKREQ